MDAISATATTSRGADFALPASHRVDEIGPEAEVVADEAVALAGIGGRPGDAGTIDRVEHGGARLLGQRAQRLVEPRDRARRAIDQRAADVGEFGQHIGQDAKLADIGDQRACLQRGAPFGLLPRGRDRIAPRRRPEQCREAQRQGTDADRHDDQAPTTDSNDPPHESDLPDVSQLAIRISGRLHLPVEAAFRYSSTKAIV
ncbi:hypothetical protein JW805_03895 [Roseomonas aeriglobus]|nr:hypothetical protein [Roseomonas aeriglobus]